MNFLETIGYRGPLILFMLNILSIWKRNFYLYFYVIFIVLSQVINVVLKEIIREPRPIGYEKSLETTYKYDKGPHRYGMPSSHSQSVFYSAIFLWLVTQSSWLLIIGLCICALTVYQRYSNKKHSLSQLLGGGIVGSLMASLAYYVSNKIILY